MRRLLLLDSSLIPKGIKIVTATSRRYTFEGFQRILKTHFGSHSMEMSDKGDLALVFGELR